MDFETLATNVIVFLTPFLPYLLSASEEMAKQIGKKFGESTCQKAKSLWNKIQNIVTSESKLNTAATGLAEDPTDKDYKLIFAKSLAKQLESAPELAKKLMGLMQQDKAIQKILIEQESTVKDIIQRLSKAGSQEAIIRGKSRAGSITQEQ